MAALDIAGIYDAVQTHLSRTGWFDRIAGHEPKNAPGNGMTAALWMAKLGPDAERSGLAATTGRLVLTVQLYCPMLTEPQDAIDLDLAQATHAVMVALSSDLTLGGLVQTIDLLGMSSSERLGGEAGYLTQDQKLYRVMTITVPMLINDLWEQGA
jgi:hypothetical protein